MPTNLTYAQLLETNQLIRKNSDTFYFQCTTRTVQESKLFPVSPYILLSYLEAFYRYPRLLQKIENAMSAEEIGDRAREATFSLHHNRVGAFIQFFLLGRQYLIDLGLMKPTDAIEDVVYALDFWKRFMLSYKRNDAHILNSDFNHRHQKLPERVLQVFEADAFGVTPGDRLHQAATRYLAQASQFTFLSHCEARPGIHSDGPYMVGDHEMIVREFVELAEGDFPWLDGVASNIPYNNLTMPVVMKDTHFSMVDDWGSFEAEPGWDNRNIVALGLYTSDYLSEGYLPVSMGSKEELADTLQHLADLLHQATTDLWKVIASWSREQMIEAGALVYFSLPKDVAHVAGVYDQDDWWTMDERTHAFKVFMNDEYGQGALGELVGFLSLPSQQANPYVMGKWSDQPRHMQVGIPYSVLVDDEFTSSVPEPGKRWTTLPKKMGLWQTTRGKLTQDEVNAAARDFRPKVLQEPYRFLDDFWVKYHYDTPLADELYRLSQQGSRNLEGRGASLSGGDIEQLRDW